MKRIVPVAAAVSLFVSGATMVLAQAKPDFTGKWVLVPDPAPPVAGSGRGQIVSNGFRSQFSVVQDDKTLSVITTGLSSDVSTRVYNLDGSERTNAISSGHWQSGGDGSRVSWDGAKLILTMTEGTQVVRVEAWFLDASGNLVIESTTTSGPPRPVKATYKRG